MAFPYKHVLMVGATSGIGKAMADRLVQGGALVTAVGRRQDRLDDFVRTHGESKASSLSFDIGQTDKAPQFVANVTKKYPEIDCIFLNAGTQNRWDLSKPDNWDLKKFNMEMHINYTSFVALVHAFLPFLLSKKTQTSIIFTGSNLSAVPAAPLPSYSASKAALNVFTLCLRSQLSGTSVKVIEVSPPVVQTELHDYMGEETGRSFGMPVDKFTEAAYSGLIAGEDQIVIGSLGPPGSLPAESFNELIDKRKASFQALTKIISAHQ